MVHKILFWSSFGIAVRAWQLGLEMRPLFRRGSLWVYPLYAGVGASFGYWMKGVEDRQLKILAQRREMIIEKRKRRAERLGETYAEPGESSEAGAAQGQVMATAF